MPNDSTKISEYNSDLDEKARQIYKVNIGRSCQDSIKEKYRVNCK
jgi:hypothetical protein